MQFRYQRGTYTALVLRINMVLQTILGRGALGTCDIWNCEILCGRNFAPTVEFRAKIWYKISQKFTKFPRLWHKNRHTPRLLASQCSLQFPDGFWMLRVTSYPWHHTALHAGFSWTLWTNHHVEGNGKVWHIF